MVVENVRGAQPWVGKATGKFGSFYLWGDVPDLPVATKATKVAGFRFDGNGGSFQTASVNGLKGAGPKSPARKFASAMIAKIPETLSRHIAQTFKPQTP